MMNFLLSYTKRGGCAQIESLEKLYAKIWTDQQLLQHLDCALQRHATEDDLSILLELLGD